MKPLMVSEISARSPDMSAREFNQLVDDIRENGQLVPIWVRGDEVIDGRKRLAACQRLGIEPNVVNADPSQDAERIARALNVLRTHYSPSQRAIYAAGRANATKGDRMGPGQIRKNPDVVTVAQAARECGVDSSSVQHAKAIARTAAPEVVAAVKSGALTLHAAAQIAKSVPKSEQPAAVEKVVEASAGKARHTPVRAVLDGESSRRGVPHPQAAPKQMADIVRGLEVRAEAAVRLASSLMTHPDRGEFEAALRRVRTQLSAAINAFQEQAA